MTTHQIAALVGVEMIFQVKFHAGGNLRPGFEQVLNEGCQFFWAVFGFAEPTNSIIKSTLKPTNVEQGRNLSPYFKRTKFANYGTQDQPHIGVARV